MPNLECIDAKIEAIVDTGDEIHVVAAISQTGDWTITNESTIGGRPIRPWLSQPRAFDAEGQPRHDIFNFVLVRNSDKDVFREGEVHVLAVHRNPTESTEEAEQGGDGDAEEAV